MVRLRADEESEDEPMLWLRCANARNLYNLLKAVQFRETGTVQACETGIKVTTEDIRCVQISAFLQKSLFQEYKLAQDSLNFKINIAVLCECLNLFGTSTSTTHPSCELSYKGPGQNLNIILEENGVVTDCSIRTMDPDEILDFDFSAANVVNKVIMKSEYLRSAFGELDPNADVAELIILPDAFKVHSTGPCGEMETEFPKDSDVIEVFMFGEEQYNKYRLNLLKPLVKPLQLSSKVSLRTDNRGFLSVQFMVDIEDGQVSFLEYFCSPAQESHDETLQSLVIE